jgi:hypothetical protein
MICTERDIVASVMGMHSGVYVGSIMGTDRGVYIGSLMSMVGVAYIASFMGINIGVFWMEGSIDPVLWSNEMYCTAYCTMWHY